VRDSVDVPVVEADAHQEFSWKKVTDEFPRALDKYTRDRPWQTKMVSRTRATCVPSVSSRVFCNEDANESQTDALDESHNGRTWPLPPHPHRASRSACLMYVAFPPTLRFPAVAGMQQGRYTCTLLRATHPKRMRRRLGSWDLFAIYCTLLRMDSFALYSHGLALTH